MLNRIVRNVNALAAIAFIALAVTATSTNAQVPDNMVMIVSPADANQGATISSYGYEPSTATMYVAGTGAGAQLRKITNIDTTPVSVLQVSPTQWSLFITDGHPGWQNPQPFPGNLTLNPQPVYDADGVTVLFPAYSFALVMDQVATLIEQPAGIRHDELTKRLYRYNLQAVEIAPNPVPPPPPYYDGRDVFSTLFTKADLKAAAGLPLSSTASDITLRQFGWSSNGQYVYINASDSNFGGIYKANVRTGQVTRIFMTNSSATNINVEPFVVHTSVRDLDPSNPAVGDQILIQGSASTGNGGGLDYLLDTGSLVTGPFHVFSEADIEKVLEWNGKANARTQVGGVDPGVNPNKTPEIGSIVVDNVGNIFFYEATGKGDWVWTAQKQLICKKSIAQHTQFIAGTGNTGSNTGTLRLQLRTAPYGSFTVPQLMFQSISPRTVGGIYIFKTGDFDRDDDVDDDDITAFLQKLTTPIGTFSQGSGTSLSFYEAPKDTNGTPLETSMPQYLDYLKYDLNGNGLVTGLDRRILWKALGFSPADYDMDGDVDQVDFAEFQACISGTHAASPGCIWIELDNDNDVDAADRSIFQNCVTGPGLPANVACAD